MPVYEYKCKGCGKNYELKLGIFHTSKSIKCPKCGSSNADRVYSPISTNTSSSGSSCSSTKFR